MAFFRVGSVKKRARRGTGGGVLPMSEVLPQAFGPADLDHAR